MPRAEMDSTALTVPVTELLTQPDLGLQVRAAATVVADRAVAWAHASELVDPTEFLRGGELLLLTGVNLPPGAQAQRTYVARLADAGVAAIAFGVGIVWDEVPPVLVEAAEAAGLPLLEVARAVPFLAITRAVAAGISRREQAAKDQVLRAQRTLTGAAVRGGGAAVLDELARLTGGWALLLNTAGTVLAGPASALTSAARASLDADLARLRTASGAASLAGDDLWVQSLHAGEELLGFLAVGGGSALDPVGRQQVNAAVPLCTLLLDRSRAAGAGARRLRTAVLRLLLAGQSAAVAEAAGELWNGLPEPPLVVLECVGERGVIRTARQRLATDRAVAAARVLHGELDGGLLSVCAAGPDVALLEHALAGVTGLRLGVSEPTDYAALPTARTQAHRAASHGAGVTRFADLPRLDLLTLLTRLPADDAEEFSTSVLRPLGADPELARSLRVWLAHHGQWDPAAAELGIHRHTLRNRIRKAERLLGRDLDSPDLRAELWLALRVAAAPPARPTSTDT